MEALITCSGQEIYKASRGQVTWTRLGHQSLPFVMMPCRDGWVGINLLFDRDWVALCELSGMTDLLEDPRSDKLAKLRLPGRAEELNGRLREWALRQEKTWPATKAQERRIPVVYVPTMPEVMESPQHLARNFLRRVEHFACSYVQPGPPFQLSVTPWRITRGAPTLGSSNDAIEELLSALPAFTRTRPEERLGSRPKPDTCRGRVMPNHRFDHQVAIVTGAGRGIGTQLRQSACVAWRASDRQ